MFLLYVVLVRILQRCILSIVCQIFCAIAISADYLDQHAFHGYVHYMAGMNT